MQSTSATTDKREPQEMLCLQRDKRCPATVLTVDDAWSCMVMGLTRHEPRVRQVADAWPLKRVFCVCKKYEMDKRELQEIL
jgi:hypothetical protein